MIDLDHLAARAKNASEKHRAHAICIPPDDLAALVRIAQAAAVIVGCEHTRTDSDDVDATSIWERLEHGGASWERCRSCGVMEKWEGGIFIRATHASLSVLTDEGAT